MKVNGIHLVMKIAKAARAGNPFPRHRLLIALLSAALLLPALAGAPAQADEVTFRFQPAPGTQAVYLAGSFNSWSTSQDKMGDADGDGVFDLVLDLAPGRYEYKFVADGNWHADPKATVTAPDGYGGQNSVVVVGEAAGAPAAAKTQAEVPAAVTAPAGGAAVQGGAAADGTYPILFTFRPDGSPNAVYLAGTFNGWSTDKNRMTDTDGDKTFELALPLAAGRHEYKFVVDGSWFADPKAAETSPDGYGGQNSVLEIGEGGAILSATTAAPAGAGAGAGAAAAAAEEAPVEGLFQVTFSFRPASKPNAIVLAGTFNEWSVNATPLSDPDEDGVYDVTLVLPGGTYQYKFVVDGTWHADPQATLTAPDGYGGQNSVIRVNDAHERVNLNAGDGRIMTKGIQHMQTISERNMLDDHEVVFRARAYRGDVEGVALAWKSDGTWQRLPMKVFSHDTAFDYYEGTLVTTASLPAFHYAFLYQDGDRELWLTPAGFEESISAAAGFAFDPATIEKIDAPAWVRDGVFYQIFPDRFYNGDPSNDQDFKEWYYEGKTTLPRMGTFDAEYFHLVKDWYDVGGLRKSPYRSDGKPDWYSFYGGDIQGVMDKLPYLHDLGITIIYFNPVFEARSNHKYDAADYGKIDPHFAGEDVFREFVARAHEMGIRVVIDVVFNHCGDAHYAFKDCVDKGPESKYWSWFEWKKWPLPKPEPVGYKADQYYACWWGFGIHPEFNFDLSRPNPDENPIMDINQAQPNWDLVNHLLETTRAWVATWDVDGFRLDVPNECPFWFWKLFAKQVRDVKPDAYIVAELWGDASSSIGPELYDATMNYRYFRDPVLEWIARGRGSAAEFDLAIAPGRSVYAPQSQQVMMNIFGSHDTARFRTEAGGDARRLKLAALFAMTYVGAPHIYYGDEIGMEGQGDPDCRRTFNWKWEKDVERSGIHDYYRKLIAIRHELPALRQGGFKTVLASGAIYAYLREHHDQRVLVVMNNSAGAVETELPLAGLELAGASFVDKLDGTGLRASGEALRVPLGPFMGRVLVVE